MATPPEVQVLGLIAGDWNSAAPAGLLVPPEYPTMQAQKAKTCKKGTGVFLSPDAV